jgi:hypothetical protein
MCDDTPNDDDDQTAPTAHGVAGVDTSIAIAVEQSSVDAIVDSDAKLPEIKNDPRFLLAGVGRFRRVGSALARLRVHVLRTQCGGLATAVTVA